jgi:hypothetical protein
MYGLTRHSQTTAALVTLSAVQARSKTTSPKPTPRIEFKPHTHPDFPITSVMRDELLHMFGDTVTISDILETASKPAYTRDASGQELRYKFTEAEGSILISRYTSAKDFFGIIYKPDGELDNHFEMKNSKIVERISYGREHLEDYCRIDIHGTSGVATFVLDGAEALVQEFQLEDGKDYTQNALTSTALFNYVDTLTFVKDKHNSVDIHMRNFDYHYSLNQESINKLNPLSRLPGTKIDPFLARALGFFIEKTVYEDAFNEAKHQDLLDVSGQGLFKESHPERQPLLTVATSGYLLFPLGLLAGTALLIQAARHHRAKKTAALIVQKQADESRLQVLKRLDYFKARVHQWLKLSHSQDGAHLTFNLRSNTPSDWKANVVYGEIEGRHSGAIALGRPGSRRHYWTSDQLKSDIQTKVQADFSTFVQLVEKHQDRLDIRRIPNTSPQLNKENALFTDFDTTLHRDLQAHALPNLIFIDDSHIDFAHDVLHSISPLVTLATQKELESLNIQSSASYDHNRKITRTESRSDLESALTSVSEALSQLEHLTQDVKTKRDAYLDNLFEFSAEVDTLRTNNDEIKKLDLHTELLRLTKVQADLVEERNRLLDAFGKYNQTISKLDATLTKLSSFYDYGEATKITLVDDTSTTDFDTLMAERAALETGPHTDSDADGDGDTHIGTSTVMGGMTVASSGTTLSRLSYLSRHDHTEQQRHHLRALNDKWKRLDKWLTGDGPFSDVQLILGPTWAAIAEQARQSSDFKSGLESAFHELETHNSAQPNSRLTLYYVHPHGRHSDTAKLDEKLRHDITSQEKQFMARIRVRYGEKPIQILESKSRKQTRHDLISLCLKKKHLENQRGSHQKYSIPNLFSDDIIDPTYDEKILLAITLLGKMSSLTP